MTYLAYRLFHKQRQFVNFSKNFFGSRTVLIRTRSEKNMKTMINWLETIRNKETKSSSLWVNVAYILHGTIYCIFAYYMRTVQSNFRNFVIFKSLQFKNVVAIYLFIFSSHNVMPPSSYEDKYILIWMFLQSIIWKSSRMYTYIFFLLHKIQPPSLFKDNVMIFFVSK